MGRRKVRKIEFTKPTRITLLKKFDDGELFVRTEEGDFGIDLNAKPPKLFEFTMEGRSADIEAITEIPTDTMFGPPKYYHRR